MIWSKNEHVVCRVQIKQCLCQTHVGNEQDFWSCLKNTTIQCLRGKSNWIEDRQISSLGISSFYISHSTQYSARSWCLDFFGTKGRLYTGPRIARFLHEIHPAFHLSLLWRFLIWKLITSESSWEHDPFFCPTYESGWSHRFALELAVQKTNFAYFPAIIDTCLYHVNHTQYLVFILTRKGLFYSRIWILCRCEALPATVKHLVIVLTVPIIFPKLPLSQEILTKIENIKFLKSAMAKTGVGKGILDK